MSRCDCGVPIGRAYRLRMLIFALATALAVLSQTSLSDAWHPAAAETRAPITSRPAVTEIRCSGNLRSV
jgi:hypothetical protein